MSIINNSLSYLMPIIFVGHGSPMNAIENNEFTKGFKTIAQTIPKPRAILCISAHWYTKGTKVTAMENPKTIHDFGGFPDTLYQVQYPAKGNLELAKQIKKLLSPTAVDLDESWGIDHGTWSVLTHFYPLADIPVVQLSIDYTKSAEYHFNLAKKLAFLRQNGVLIIGSGNIIHNLSLVDFQNFDKDDYGYDWAKEAQKTMNQWIREENFEALINYEKQSKAIQLAIPSPDHFLPLIYILALKEKSEKITFFNDKLVAGSLSMTSVIISEN
ncbi:MAG: 4,5-DOPA dioxygenase extradiol [Bacteroidota bacterium]